MKKKHKNKQSKSYKKSRENRQFKPVIDRGVLEATSPSEIRLLGSLAQMGYFFEGIRGDALAEYIFVRTIQAKGWEENGKHYFKNEQHLRDRCVFWANYVAKNKEKIFESQLGI